MKKFTLTLIFSMFAGVFAIFAQDKIQFPPNFQPDTRIDNIGYWQMLARYGYVPVSPMVNVPAAKYNGTKIFNSKGVLIDDSPDVAVTTEVSTQSENSIVVDPNNNSISLNSNNSTPQPSTGSVYGADYYVSDDEGLTWTGSKQGAGGGNSGDPAACINLTGRYFIGFIDNQSGQSVSYSDDGGVTWTMKKVATGSAFNMLDKNHLWVDISPASPYKGNLYNGWMVNNGISVSRSITNGTSWESPHAISAGTSAGSHNQGLNFKCGPDGEVYCVWAVYDSWPSDEKALGFAKSLDGGVTWTTATRIINNIKGIRTSGVIQNMRTNSFPSMACDLSNGPNHGALYVVWSNHGVPGVNTGSDVDVYMIKSTDKGDTWSAPIRINNDPIGAGKQHYLPWITCDQANGNVAIVFYDNRNVNSNQAEAWVAYSTDGGGTFENFKVSDVSFTPNPIPLMASDYMGDYLSISAYNGKVYPCWTDNRLGYCMTYVSPFDMTVPAPQVIYNQNFLNDTTFGNGNGMMDYGETELLGLKLKNEGTADASAVDVTVTSESPYITMIDSTEYFGDFTVGQSRSIYNCFKFRVSDSIPHGQMIPFLVKAKDATDSVTVSTFYIQSFAPAVTIVSMEIADPSGNNNGRLDPGENVTLHILTKNTGTWPALNAVSELTSSNPLVTVSNPVQNIGDLQPGAEVTVDFNVNVHSITPIGSATLFHNYTHAGYQSDNKDWLVKIGLIIEDWETGNFTKFPWQFSGNANWQIDTIHWEKIYSAKSGTIANGDTSTLFINYNVLYDDSITFYRKTQSDPSDKLFFYIDDAQIGQWGGNQPFRKYAYPVTAGPHTFKWSYIKDGSNIAGSDAAWVDYITFPPEYKTAIFAGENATACGNVPFELQGLAINYDSLLWTTSGTGTFENPAILNTSYLPSAADVSAGSVILTLSAWSNNGIQINTTMTLTLEAGPEAYAGEDAEICASPMELTTTSALNYTSVSWTTSGDGTFSNSAVLHPVYTPGTQDIANGHVDLTLNVTPVSASCQNITDAVSYTLKPAPVFTLGQDTAICGDRSYVLDATATGATSYQWSTGATTPSITVDSTGTGYGSAYFSVIVTGGNGCETADTIKITFKNCLGVEEIKGLSAEIYPNPNKGAFTIRLNSAGQKTINIRITSQNGSAVYSENDITVSGSVSRKIELNNIAQGNYILEIYDGSGKILKKLTVQK